MMETRRVEKHWEREVETEEWRGIEVDLAKDNNVKGVYSE